ncbi:lantibiotic dehydratase [Kibdelosporangium philippinense]|uniref:Lantibiotic dehydratase n=1 Tax=Kibdelosporangium philippinense TaxID=211113 RepID=A0ABS8ZQJ4_9PSEU|nr:lantibiotic dehydratase [Kibdelosporangium philippinense]MCE7010028.1 lantibiotic dehydratase [Kibdelosporangium philippinense]
MRSTSSRTPLYQHCGVGLLRAAATPLDRLPERWPDPADTEACRAWLNEVWSAAELADPIRHASPGLAMQVDTMDDAVAAKQVRRATLATIRYLLRAAGRHTPFGLFAGVAPVMVCSVAALDWGTEHRAFARADTQWLADVIDQLEACPELLERLDVVFTNLATVRGNRLEAPHGPNRVTARYTSAVRAAWSASASPVRFADLIYKVAESFPSVDISTIRAMLESLVQQGFLITFLHAPVTITDPLKHLVDRLQEVDAHTVPAAAPILEALEAVQADLQRHNDRRPDQDEQGHLRARVIRQMRVISTAGRTPLGVDLCLHADVQLPETVAREMEWAATALVRLTRQPTGHALWREFYTAFCDRYGTGTLVPLADVVDPDTGLGLPATYPGSVLPEPTATLSDRDERLLALGANAIANNSREIIFTEETIQALTVGDPDAERRIPPHVELATRIHAPSAEAIKRGEYTITVAPARSAGTFTSRFTTVVRGCGLEQVYAAAPTAVAGALPVQLSFPPVYPNGENICRVPAYLPHVLALGEHRRHQDEQAVIQLDDLAITATRTGLHLVSLSRQQVIEPQVFHALALEKQPPPLARFLAHLPRALSATWHEFDWGPAAQHMPFLPRIRFRRAILSPARWRLDAVDLPADVPPNHPQWISALRQWQSRWRCPATVEVRDADRSLRLTTDVPAHAAILHAHINRHGHAVLVEVPEIADFGWAGGHVHEIALPLVSTRPPAPSPPIVARPVITNSGHGQLPGSAETNWLYAKVYTHPERVNEIISDWMPRLLADLDSQTPWWFVRYRSPQETDHIRLRLHASNQDSYSHCLTAVGNWAQQLRHKGTAARLVIDTYLPEVGRYGHGAALDAAEAVFVADSAAVAAQLRRLSPKTIDSTSLAALGLVATVEGFLGGRDAAMDWLRARPAPTGTTVDQTLSRQVTRLALANELHDLPGWTEEIATAWKARADALAVYRTRLPDDADAVLESLLHMHHNRAAGIDRDNETLCRRLARQAALAWHAGRVGVSR